MFNSNTVAILAQAQHLKEEHMMESSSLVLHRSSHLLCERHFDGKHHIGFAPKDRLLFNFKLSYEKGNYEDTYDSRLYCIL